MRKKRIPIICYSIFAVMGIVIIGLAVWVLVSGIRFRKTSVSITGKVEDIVTYYDNDDEAHDEIFVTYTFEGQTYERIKLNEHGGNMYVGKTIELLCDPQNPGRVEMKSTFWISVITLGIMGIVCFSIGAIPLYFSIKKSLQNKRLRAKGRVLCATVEKITLDTTMTIEGQNPYLIYCTWWNEHTGRQVQFKSERLWKDPGNLFSRGSKINVYVDENTLSKYYVDAEHSPSQQVYDFT